MTKKNAPADVRGSRRLTFSLAAIILTNLAGCLPLLGTEFREAASPAVRSGVTEIVNGLLDGIFAAIEPEPDN